MKFFLPLSLLFPFLTSCTQKSTPTIQATVQVQETGKGESQQEQPISEKTEAREVVKKIERTFLKYNVSITNQFSEKTGDNVAILKIYEKDKLIDEKTYKTNALGGTAGLELTDFGGAEPSTLILNLDGSYNKRFILIDDRANIVELPSGGSVFQSGSIIFTPKSGGSDDAGFGVYDLKKGKQLSAKNTSLLKDEHSYSTMADFGNNTWCLGGYKSGSDQEEQECHFLKMTLKGEELQLFENCGETPKNAKSVSVFSTFDEESFCQVKGVKPSSR